MPEQSDVAEAILRRLAQHFNIELAVDTVNLDQSLFSDAGVSLGGNELDSLDLVEAIATLEENLRVSLLDQDIATLDTINLLAAFVVRNAEPSVVVAFCGAW